MSFWNVMHRLVVFSTLDRWMLGHWRKTTYNSAWWVICQMLLRRPVSEVVSGI